jgi:hypothetical protein
MALSLRMNPSATFKALSRISIFAGLSSFTICSMATEGEVFVGFPG